MGSDMHRAPMISGRDAWRRMGHKRRGLACDILMTKARRAGSRRPHPAGDAWRWTTAVPVPEHGAGAAGVRAAMSCRERVRSSAHPRQGRPGAGQRAACCERRFAARLGRAAMPSALLRDRHISPPAPQPGVGPRDRWLPAALESSVRQNPWRLWPAPRRCSQALRCRGPYGHPQVRRRHAANRL